jgi:uncharacterized membrane protein YgcG
MVMRQARVVRTGALALCALALFGCAKTGDSADVEGPVGSARFSVQIVPADVNCIRITADGTRDRTQSFDATPNQSAQFTMPSLPAGSVTFSAEAFPVKCSKVTATTLPTWVSDPVTAEITAGGVTSVKLIMRPVGSADIGIDFQDGGATGGSGGSGGSGGGAGSGGTSGSGGSSGTGGSSGSGGTGGSAGTGGSSGTAGTGGGSGLPPGVWDTTNWDNAVWQ